MPQALNTFVQVFKSGAALYTMALAGAALRGRRGVCRRGRRERNGAVEVAIVLVALIILDVLAFRFGADSRDGFGRRDGGAPAGRGRARARVWWAEPERERPGEAPATW